MKRGCGKNVFAALMSAVMLLTSCGNVVAAGTNAGGVDSLIDNTTAMSHKEKRIKLTSKADDRVMLYRNNKNQMRIYVCSTKRTPEIYKLSGSCVKKDKKDPMLTLTKRRKRTKPYGDYGVPIWNSTKTAFYTEHFNTIYKCSKSGKIIKKVDVLKKIGLSKKDYWLRKMERVEKETFALSVMNGYDDTEKIYLFDMKKNKIKRRYGSEYQRLLGTAEGCLYLLSYEDEEPYEIVKVRTKTGQIEARISAESMVCEENQEVIGTIYNDELYLCNEKGIFMWNEYTETFDQLLDGSLSFQAGKRPYSMLFTADDKVFITTEGNELYSYTMTLHE